MSYRLRLIAAFVLVVVVAIVTILFIVQQGTIREVGRYMTRSSMGLEALAAGLEDYYLSVGSWEGSQSLLESYRSGRGMGMMSSIHLRLADASGKVIADNNAEPTGSLSRTERNVAILLYGPRGETVGYLLAEGGAGMMMQSGENQLLTRLVQASLIAAGVAGALALVIALLLSYTLIKPVEALTGAAARMAAGDLSQRVPVRGRDELATLGSAFNHMASSLQQAEQNRRALTADIAHELRTPIAIQRAHLEALQDGIYPLTSENLQPVLEQTDLLTRLVDDLRTLALADAGELRLERALVDPVSLAQRVVERFRPESESRSIRLSLLLDENHIGTVLLDAGRVEQILNNLLSNALRHTPSGGEVQLHLDKHQGALRLRVEDTGPGIPPESLPRLFERFYRADKSRSRTEGGTGLGLAIARQLALAHGGDLEAANRPVGGAVFTLRLPLSQGEG